MKVLVVGASGMLGHVMMRVLSENSDWSVVGSIRHESLQELFSKALRPYLISGINVEEDSFIVKVLEETRPDVVINCAGLTKHKSEANDPVASIVLNSLLPHRLAKFCKLFNVRLIHISTDCVFSGKKGNYVEDDLRDAKDLYGQSKALGELIEPNALTLRISTIGHELQGQYGLLNWFLSQKEQCNGYNRAIFSGLPTVIFARIIRDIVIPNAKLSGLYHVAAKPINKFDLLHLIAKTYDKEINIIADESLVIDRSLNANRFQLETGFIAPDWPELIKSMHDYK